jgi:hypothetical protein
LKLLETIFKAKRALNIVVVISRKVSKLPISARKLVPDKHTYITFEIMSKRRGDALREPVAKRSKRGRLPSPDARISVAGGVYSVRKVASHSFPTLATLAIKAFTTNLLEQTSEEKKAYTISVLQGLPEHLVSRVWLQLIEAWPERMNHGFIVAACSWFGILDID